MALLLVAGAELAACGSSGGEPATENRGVDPAGRADTDSDQNESKSSVEPSKAHDAGNKINVDAGHDSATHDSSETGSGSAGALPCDVQRIVSQRCGTCHGATTSFGAPMSLASAADFQAAGATDRSKKVYQLVKSRVNATDKSMPPPGSPALANDEKKTLNDWLDAGAPGSDQPCSTPPGPGDADAGPSGDQIDVSDLECHKFLAHAEGSNSAKYPVGTAVDSYVDMGFKAPWDGVRYGAVIRPVVDNMKAIHHWLLYEESTTDGSIEAGIGQHPGGNLVAGWAPGGPVYDFRKFDNAGLELPGTSYVLELHYNSADPNAEDASGAEICLSKDTPKNIVTNSWLGYDNWFLAGDLDGPRTTWTGTCVPVSQEPIHILYVTPHMHLAGRHMTAIINQPDGGQRMLLDEPFEFAYQTTYEENVVLMPGETITTTCTFSEPKEFGQGTQDEMCYLFTYHYPRHALSDNGAWGMFAHGEGACLGQ